MAAKLMMEQDGFSGCIAGSKNNTNHTENETDKKAKNVDNPKHSPHVQAATMEEFIEQRKNEFVFL